MLLNFAVNFELLAMKYGSDLFSKTWRENLMCAVRDKPEFSIDHVHHHVWKPTLDHFIHLIDSVVYLTIKLSDVDKYFKGQENLDTHLVNLFHGVRECMEREHDDLKPIRTALNAISDYWHFCAYRNGADVFLELKNVLELTEGDFNLVQNFATDVRLIRIFVVVE